MSIDPARLQDLSGVLPDHAVQMAVDAGWLDGGDYTIPQSNIQPASVDLRLGPVAFRLRSSFLPGQRSVKSTLVEYQLGPSIDLRDGAVLEKNRPYLIPLIEGLRLPPWLRARANPKSSIGRLDVFTRVLADRSPGFDEISAGYCGPLYLEVISRSFTIQVHEKLSLNQLRLIVGDARLNDEDIRRVHERTPLLYTYGTAGVGRRAVPSPNLLVSNGLFLRVDLSGDDDRLMGYRAKKNSMLLNLSLTEHHRVEDFWDPLFAGRENRLILEPEEFYLLMSAEGVSIPPGLAGEMTAYDPTSGELRTHYAGFFDPGFGYAPEEGVMGSRAVLEVRAHDVPFSLEDNQKIARLEFEKMVDCPQKLYGPQIGSSYQNQRLTPSKHFKSPSPQPPQQLDLLGDAPATPPRRSPSRARSQPSPGLGL
ncbi:MAG: 2'-deoxycytidine 5'-triphosphate deaminase [Bacillota bacterium]|nr:2'-deoxycytidine 5'-triphosphate deaminase [Bacillota bacterium]